MVIMFNMFHFIIILIILFKYGSCQENLNGIKIISDRIKGTIQTSDLEQLISDILNEKRSTIKCFVIMCDIIYCNAIHNKIFHRIKTRFTYFWIQVEESEDLLAPELETKQILNQVKAEGCNFYIILLANGLQTSRFLQFGDRYRMIDTRANFILLYDIRLFNKNFYYLWKRIVNVIFVRQYGGNSRTGVSIPWFDISTVPFPSPILGVFIPHRLDTWRNGHFRLGVDLFRDKTLDLKKQIFKVVTFQHIPATTKTYIHSGNATNPIYSGLEIEILQTLSNQMNFETSLYEPLNADVEKWGEKQDGKFAGLIGEMVKFQAEIALGDLYYSPYHLELMDLTVPYNTECLTFLTPESLNDNSWITLILPFKIYMWLTVILVIFIVGFIFLLLAKFERYLSNKSSKKTYVIVQSKSTDFYVEKLNDLFKQLKFRKRRIQIIEHNNQNTSGLYLFEQMFNTFLYTYSMLLLVSLPKLPDGWSLRVMVGWYWLYCILVVVAYKASMTAILANPASKITIDSLEELEQTNLPCGGWGENIKQFFITSLDLAGQQIGERFEHVNDTDLAIDRVIRGEFAYYENIYYLKSASVKRQSSTHDNNNHNLHIMSDCVINMPISIGLQKNSPIKPRVDLFIQRIIESGFVKKWLDDVMQKNGVNNAIHRDSETIAALINLRKLYAGFVALFLGYLVSCIALVLELMYWNYVVRRHPNFDKYTNTIVTPNDNKNKILI